MSKRKNKSNRGASSTQIGPSTRAQIAYVAYDEDDDVVDQHDEADPLAYTHGFGQLPPGLERQLEGLSVGQTKTITLSPSEGFGDHDPDGVFEVDRADFADEGELEIGDELVAEGPEGAELRMRVLDVLEDAVLVDTNHPLAGQDLRFEVKVIEVRAATDEEMAKAERELAEREFEEAGCGPGNEAGSALIQLGRKPRNAG